MPYVFTEQGIAMLSSVLKSDEAVEISINIMNAFVKMRRFVANNSLFFDRINNLELKQIQMEKETNKNSMKYFHIFHPKVKMIKKYSLKVRFSMHSH